ncbi:UNVERIFIED_CONTAM: hypothetical protein Scaly_1033600 [Sesamum calycinum]|uniref:Retrovirus-related Pol polyprotein from transposon TNT 1-94 n=1 Tax=Sesamum calycinum TaxID=2727403 RepID=A0AAW2QL63_9LAMI
MNKSLTEMARCLRLNAGLPKSFWAEVVSMTCYLINRSPRASLGGKIAKEVWIDNPVNFDHLRIFGCSAYVHVPSDERSNLDRSPSCASFWATRKVSKMESEPHPVGTKNHGSTHPTSGDPLAIESGGSSHLTSGGSTANELQAYNLARDRQRRTNVKPPGKLGYEDMVSFALLNSGDEPTTFHGAITSQEKKE